MAKRKLASAIGYSQGDVAPTLLASGRGHDAQRIIAIAEKAGVAVVEDSALAALLDTFSASRGAKPGDYIPPWCWEAAAKVLAFVIDMDKKIKKD
jgi:flagellar biosynthesis protein